MAGSPLSAGKIAKFAAQERRIVQSPRDIAVLVIGTLEAVVGDGQREGKDLDWMIERGVRSIDILLRGAEAW